jgi:hypothetical protein
MFALDEAYGECVLRAIFAISGSRYDWWLNVCWLFAGIGNKIWRLFGYEGDKWRPKGDTPDRRNCSEAAAEALSACSVPGHWTSWMNPGQFVESAKDSVALSTVPGHERVELLKLFIGE